MVNKFNRHTLSTSQTGVTLIELMIAITISMILFLIMGTVYSNHYKMIQQNTQQTAAEQDIRFLIGTISELVKQADICGTCNPAQDLSISYGISTHPSTKLMQTNDSFSVIFYLPYNYKIWPNTIQNAGIYDQNTVQIHWSQNSGVLEYRKAINSATLSSIAYTPIETPGAKTPRITQLELWPMLDATTPQPLVTDLPSGGYRLCMTARGYSQDGSYINPDDATGPMKNYRTAQSCHIIFPQNW